MGWREAALSGRGAWLIIVSLCFLSRVLSKSLCIAIVGALREYSAQGLGLRTMRHIISILLQNEAGALGRVAGMFSTRGYNIESLNVAPTDDHSVSRLTLVTTGSDEVIDQITKQLGKLVDVVDIADMTSGDHIERELVFIKVQVPWDQQRRLITLVEKNGGRTLDNSREHVTLEFAGDLAEVDRFINRIRDLADIVAVVRSGVMAVARGAPLLSSN